MQKRIIFRLSDKMDEQVKNAIKEGKAKNPSDLARLALDKFLNEQVTPQ